MSVQCLDMFHTQLGESLMRRKCATRHSSVGGSRGHDLPVSPIDAVEQYHDPAGYYYLTIDSSTSPTYGGRWAGKKKKTSPNQPVIPVTDRLIQDRLDT